MTDLLELLSAIAHLFHSRGLSHPRRRAEELLCDALDCDRAVFYSTPIRLLSETEERTIRFRAERHLQGEPLAYIHGTVQFYGCALKVNPSVLIPRQETEILVDKIVQSLIGRPLKGKILWDLCSGSGCIGIALKKTFPDLTVYLSDIFEEAVALSHENALLNGVDLTCLTGDLLIPFSGMKADYIVCNPPYVSDNEYLHLEREVRAFEPRLALLAGEEGLDIYRRLAGELHRYLLPAGQVWFEIGYRQGPAVMQIFQGSSHCKRYFENDWSGNHRFFFLENE